MVGVALADRSYPGMLQAVPWDPFPIHPVHPSSTPGCPMPRQGCPPAHDVLARQAGTHAESPAVLGDCPWWSSGLPRCGMEPAAGWDGVLANGSN